MRVIVREPSVYFAEYEVEGLPAEATDDDILSVVNGDIRLGVRVQLVNRWRDYVAPATVHMRGQPDAVRAGGQLAEARAALERATEAAKQAAAAADRVGDSERQIAAALGVNRNTLRAWLGKPRRGD